MATTVSSQDCNAAAEYIGKHMIDYVPGTRQVLVLSDMSRLERFGLGSINRDVNPAWVQHLKPCLMESIHKKERITVVAAIDVREIIAAHEDVEAARDFKAIILDGQHRLTALKEIKEDYPLIEYDFRVDLFLVSTDDELMELLSQINDVRKFSQDDADATKTRQRFVQVLNKLAKNQKNRRCITGTRNHSALRNAKVMASLGMKTSQEIEKKILMIAKKHECEWNEYKSPELERSALGQTIQSTGLYQLINWQSGKWLHEL
jgi:hypothetical protein